MEAEKIAKFLIFLRKEKGVTQQDIADFIGVSNKTVSKWETGAAIPDSFYLPLLAKYYDVSADEILEGSFCASSMRTPIRFFPLGIATTVLILGIVFHFIAFLILKERGVCSSLYIIIYFGIALSSIGLIITIIGHRRCTKMMQFLYGIFLAFACLELFSFILMSITLYL